MSGVILTEMDLSFCVMADVRLVMTLWLAPPRGRHIFSTEQSSSRWEPASFQNLLPDFLFSFCAGHWGHVQPGGKMLGAGSPMAEAQRPRQDQVLPGWPFPGRWWRKAWGSPRQPGREGRPRHRAQGGLLSAPAARCKFGAPDSGPSAG